MTRTLLPALLACAASLLTPGRAPAQCDLPRAIVEAATLSAEQEREIQRYVGEHARLLETQERAEMSRGRECLMRPLANRAATVSFRLAYSGALTPTLARIAGAPDEPQAINALIVCGALGTFQAADVLDQFRADPRVPVRYTAVNSCARLFQAIALSSPAMAENDALRVVDRIGAQLAEERHPEIVDACVRSLIAAAGVSRENFARLRPHSTAVLAARMVERVKALPVGAESDALLPAVVRAGTCLRDAAAQINVLTLDERTVRSIVEFGGRCWAHVVRRLQAGDFPAIQPGDAPEAAAAKREARKVIVQVVGVGQATMFLGAARMAQERPFEPKAPVEWVAEAVPQRDELFVRRARELCGPGGILMRPPFNFPEPLVP